MEKQEIPFLRAGMMGIVCGMKGGAPAGALMGAIVMSVSTANVTIFSLWLYTIVVGLTLGLMGGATFGAIYGFSAGLASHSLLQRGESAYLIWIVFSLLFFVPIVWVIIPEFG